MIFILLCTFFWPLLPFFYSFFILKIFWRCNNIIILFKLLRFPSTACLEHLTFLFFRVVKHFETLFILNWIIFQNIKSQIFFISYFYPNSLEIFLKKYICIVFTYMNDEYFIKCEIRHFYYIIITMKWNRFKR